MDCKFNFIKEGIIKLPPGFRFQPTDEELVFQYLKRKVLSWPLPASIIPDINLCKFDPWDLPGDMEEERYFFSNKEAKYPNGNKINRATASGYWKATGLDRKITCSSSSFSKNNHIMGMRKTLVFYRGKSSHASRTNWFLHEYRLVNIPNSASNLPLPSNPSPKNSVDQWENWVLCRIFLKNRNSAEGSSEILRTCKCNKANNSVASELRFFDFMKRERIVSNSGSSSSSSSSSSSTSAITEVSSSADDHEDCSNIRHFF